METRRCALCFLRLKWVDSGCNVDQTIVKMFDALVVDSFDPDVIVGPPCSAGRLYDDNNLAQ